MYYRNKNQKRFREYFYRKKVKLWSKRFSIIIDFDNAKIAHEFEQFQIVFLIITEYYKTSQNNTIHDIFVYSNLN